MGTAPIPMRPEAKELVTLEVLRWTGLGAQAFSGTMSPSTIFQMMVQGSPGVMPYYREVEEKDTAVSSALAMRRLLVLARDTAMQPADPQNGQARELSDAAAAFLDSIPRFGFALWELLDAPAYGYSVVETLWQTDGSAVGVERLVGRPQELFRFGRIADPQVGDLVLANFPGGEGQPVPPQKFLVTSYHPRHGDRRGMPLLRRLYWPSWFKRNVLRLHLKFLEKGPGTVAVKYPSGAGDDEKKKALEAAEAIADEIAVAVPETFALIPEALQTTRTRQAEDFRALFDYFDAEMTRIVLGQTLTTRGAEQQRGTQALGQVHENTMWQVVRGDAADLEAAINEQLLGPWLLWTFGPGALERAVRPWWTIEKDPPRDAAAAADLLVKAHQLVELPTSEVYEMVQVRAPEEGENVVPRSAVPASLFQPGL